MSTCTGYGQLGGVRIYRVNALRTGLSYAQQSVSLADDERKPHTAGGDRGDRGAARLLPGLLQVPMPGEGRYLQPARGMR